MSHNAKPVGATEVAKPAPSRVVFVRMSDGEDLSGVAVFAVDWLLDLHRGVSKSIGVVERDVRHQDLGVDFKGVQFFVPGHKVFADCGDAVLDVHEIADDDELVKLLGCDSIDDVIELAGSIVVEVDHNSFQFTATERNTDIELFGDMPLAAVQS